MIKYLKNGEKVEVIKKLETGYVVSKYYNYDNDGYIEEDVSNEQIYVEEVFNSLPATEYHKKIKFLKEEIVELNNEKNKTEKKVMAAKDKYWKSKQKNEELLKILSENEGLENIREILDSKVEYYVYTNPDSMGIGPVLENDTSKRLLTLYGRQSGVRWVLSEKSDGSGAGKSVIPCISMKDARKKLKEEIIKALDSCNPINYPYDRIIRAAQKNNIDISPKYAKAKIDAEIERQRKFVEKAKLELADQEKELEKLTNEGERKNKQ